jgi:hypothetical protein
VAGDAEAQACRDMGRSRPYAARVHVLLDVALHNVVPARHPRVSIVTPAPSCTEKLHAAQEQGREEAQAMQLRAPACFCPLCVPGARVQVLALLGRLQTAWWAFSASPCALRSHIVATSLTLLLVSLLHICAA